MPTRPFQLRVLGETIAASWVWDAVGFTVTPVADMPPPLKLAGTGLRWSTSVATVDGNNYKATDYAIGMPDVEVTELFLFFPTFYATTSGGGGEIDCPNGYTIEGIATKAADGTRTLCEIDGGSGPVVLDPDNPATPYGKWVRVTPAAPIPAGAVQVFSFAYFLPDGEIPLGRPTQTLASLTNIFGQVMPVERSQGSSASLLSTLSDSTAYLNQNGPRPPLPAMMMVPSDQTAYLGIGDSIDYGSAHSGNVIFWPNRMAFGHLELAMDDAVSSRRIHGGNMAIPGWNMTNTTTAGSHGNATASTRQLWAIEKAVELNGGLPVADIIVSAHGQNSSNENSTVMINSARSLAALWRGALGDEDTPVWWIGMPPSPTSTDGFQTLENQEPREATSIFPDGSRWVFNAALDDGGALRTDGTVQAAAQLWPVSSAPDPDRDIYAVRPFTAEVTADYSGTGSVFMDTAPPLGAWLGFIRPDNSVVVGTQVQAVTGSGPFEVTMPIPTGPSFPTGTIVRERWTDGNNTTGAVGVHPSSTAHFLYAARSIAMKVAQGFTSVTPPPPPPPPPAPPPPPPPPPPTSGFVGSEVVFDSATTIPTPIDVPDEADAGDLLLAFGATGGPQGAFLAPSGWTQDRTVPQTTALSLASYDGTTASYTFNLEVAGQRSLSMLAYREYDLDVVGSFTATVTANPVAPGITVAENDSIILAFVGGSAPNTEWDAPAGWTRRVISVSNRSQTVFERDAKASSGALDAVTFTRTAGTGNSRAVLVALSPAA